MVKKDREFLSQVCSSLEERFPGLTAAFENFVTISLGGQRDGYRIVEVFNIPSWQMEEAWSVVQDIVGGTKCSDGSAVMFHLWDCQETAAHFRDDISAIQAARRTWDVRGVPYETMSFVGHRSAWVKQVSPEASPLLEAA